MNGQRKRKVCDWCRSPALYVHGHVMEPAEYACAEHWNGCRSCRYIGPDKYHHKTTSEEQQ